MLHLVCLIQLFVDFRLIQMCPSIFNSEYNNFIAI
jgi:hypothetical protein